MKLGFIGVGQVGGTLAKKLGMKGHSVYLGSRNKNEEVVSLAKSIGAHSSVETLSDCILKSDIIFLATPWNAVEGFTKEYSVLLKDKILIDCTNPLKSDLSGLLFTDSSGGEFIQHALSNTKVVKAFNTVGFNIMENPILDGQKAVMYFCGNDGNAKNLVKNLIDDVGLNPIDAGDIHTSKLLENFALLWISSAYKFGMGREFAFSLIRRK